MADIKIVHDVHSAVVYKLPRIIKELKKAGFTDDQLKVETINTIEKRLIIIIPDEDDNQDPSSIFLLGTFVGQLEYS